jgi:hypothetical protein
MLLVGRFRVPMKETAQLDRMGKDPFGEGAEMLTGDHASRLLGQSSKLGATVPYMTSPGPNFAWDHS